MENLIVLNLGASRSATRLECWATLVGGHFSHRGIRRRYGGPPCYYGVSPKHFDFAPLSEMLGKTKRNAMGKRWIHAHLKA